MPPTPSPRIRIPTGLRKVLHQHRGLVPSADLLHRAILNVLHDGVVFLDLEARVVTCNPSAERLLGVTEAQLKGVASVDPAVFGAIDEAGHPVPEEAHPSRVTLRTGEPCLGVVQGIHTSQGELKWISVNAQPIRENGVLKGVVVSLSDITPTKRLEARLRQEAYHDDLTGLFNRRYLTTELARAVNSARRHGHPISLCLCDLDHFKVVNDTFGHGSGDRALQAFAETILLELRQDELAARFGGDEFCILYAHSEAAQAARSLQRILANLNELTVAAEDGRPFRLAASFGIADLEAAHQDHEDFLEAADRALYAAKAAGRNRVHVLSRS